MPAPFAFWSGTAPPSALLKPGLPFPWGCAGRRSTQPQPNGSGVSGLGLCITRNFQAPKHRIPTGFRPKAKGCEARAILGEARKNIPTPPGLCSARDAAAATPLGLWPISSRFPKVARAAPPLGRNPFGIDRNSTPPCG